MSVPSYNMRISLRELRQLVWGALQENRGLPKVWYHGSRWGNMGSAGNFQGKYMFLTDSRKIAEQYFRPLLAAGRRPRPDAAEQSVLYEVQLLLSDEQVFDTRRPEHMQLFYALAKEAIRDDPDEPDFTKSSLMQVYAAPGSTISGTFPGYGCVRPLLDRLKSHGYLASFIAEGDHGASLAVSNPQANVAIVSVVEPRQ